MGRGGGTKKDRQEKIIEIVQSREIDTQEALAAALEGEGYSVTQATVSRDIRLLGLVKMSLGDGRQKYMLPERKEGPMEEKYVRVLKEGFLSMDKAGNILVVKTVSGMAMAVAAALDALQLPEIVGCIAGDDTIMAALRTPEDTSRVMKRLQEMLA